MSNRAQALQQAIEESESIAKVTAPKEDRPKKKRADIRVLHASWGGKDADFYFRKAAAAIGFKAQTIEHQAEVVGKKVREFYDERRFATRKECAECNALHSLRANVCRQCGHPFSLVPKGITIPEVRALLEKFELARGFAARPSHGQQVRVIKDPERVTDAHLDAISWHRRVSAGMAALEKSNLAAYHDLEAAFYPSFVGIGPRTMMEPFAPLLGLILRDGPLVECYERAMSKAKEGDRFPLADWLERRIDQKRQKAGIEPEDVMLDGHKVTLSVVIDRAVARAEAIAIAAIEAYEAVAAKPPDVIKAEADAAEKVEKKARGEPIRRGPRRPKVSLASEIVPEGWGSWTT